jgi:hypothetical protein
MKLKFIALAIFLISILVCSQTNFEPVTDLNIYEFLNRMSIEGLISFKDEIRPLPKKEIAEKLVELEKESSKLSGPEKGELQIYTSEFYYDIKKINGDTTRVEDFLNFNPDNRFNLYSYYNKDFSIKVDPIAGVSYSSGRKTYHDFTGIGFQGTFTDDWGYYFNYRDNYEQGNDLNRKKLFTPETGVIISKGGKDYIEYSEVRGGLTYNWKWGDITMAKDFINIGSSYNSQVILSSNAPSFPFIRLDIHPIRWLRFTYFHGWLNSGLIDSSTIRLSGIDFPPRKYTYQSRDKFIVSHMLSFDIKNRFTFSIGESMIYGDKLQVLYLMPIMFYRLADHYLSKDGSYSSGNASIFLNANYKVPEIKSQFYGTLYIDEMSPSKFFNKNGGQYQTFGFQVGGVFVDPLWKNSSINLEYTAIDPYAYKNADTLEQYSSENYQLGDWIGSNADQILISIEQNITGRFKLNASYEYIRQGAQENRNNFPIHYTHAFLYGGTSYYANTDIKLQYIPVDNFYVELEYMRILAADGRFKQEYGINYKNDLSFAIHYGM